LPLSSSLAAFNSRKKQASRLTPAASRDYPRRRSTCGSRSGKANATSCFIDPSISFSKKKGVNKFFPSIFYFPLSFFLRLPNSLDFQMQARSAACSLRSSGISTASSSGRESSSSFSIGSPSSSTRNRRRRNRQTKLVASALAAEPSAFRPCIDIHKGKVKQIVGSTLSDLDKAR